MLDDTGTTGAEQPAGPPEANSAWRDVLKEFDMLGDAIGRWAKAAVNDPDNQRRLNELSDRLEGLVDSVGSSIKGAADTEVGDSFKEAAEKTGEAFKVAGAKFSEEVGPRLSSAFRTMGDKLRGAAEKMDAKQSAQTPQTTPDEAPDGESEPPSGPTA